MNECGERKSVLTRINPVGVVVFGRGQKTCRDGVCNAVAHLHIMRDAGDADAHFFCDARGTGNLRVFSPGAFVRTNEDAGFHAEVTSIHDSVLRAHLRRLSFENELRSITHAVFLHCVFRERPSFPNSYTTAHTLMRQRTVYCSLACKYQRKSSRSSSSIPVSYPGKMLKLPQKRQRNANNLLATFWCHRVRSPQTHFVVSKHMCLVFRLSHSKTERFHLRRFLLFQNLLRVHTASLRLKVRRKSLKWPCSIPKICQLSTQCVRRHD